MPLDDQAFLLLHEVRLCGLVHAPDGPAVAHLLDAGLVVRTSGGLRVTAGGAEMHATWARLVPGSDVEAIVDRAFLRFVPLNAELLRLCTDWQVRPGGVPNDHTDVGYDWAVLDRLRIIDERVAPVVRRVARAVDRFGAYRGRLRDALRRVDEGAPEWFTSPRLDSYHTVWMRLHEDLLLALGRDRGSEPEP